MFLAFYNHKADDISFDFQSIYIKFSCFSNHWNEQWSTRTLICFSVCMIQHEHIAFIIQSWRVGTTVINLLVEFHKLVIIWKSHCVSQRTICLLLDIGSNPNISHSNSFEIDSSSFTYNFRECKWIFSYSLFSKNNNSQTNLHNSHQRDKNHFHDNHQTLNQKRTLLSMHYTNPLLLQLQCLEYHHHLQQQYMKILLQQDYQCTKHLLWYSNCMGCILIFHLLQHIEKVRFPTNNLSSNTIVTNLLQTNLLNSSIQVLLENIKEKHWKSYLRLTIK